MFLLFIFVISIFISLEKYSSKFKNFLIRCFFNIYITNNSFNNAVTSGEQPESNN